MRRIQTFRPKLKNDETRFKMRFRPSNPIDSECHERFIPVLADGECNKFDPNIKPGDCNHHICQQFGSVVPKFKEHLVWRSTLTGRTVSNCLDKRYFDKQRVHRSQAEQDVMTVDPCGDSVFGFLLDPDQAPVSLYTLLQRSCSSIPLPHRHSILWLPCDPFLFCTNTPSLSSSLLIDTCTLSAL